MRHERDSVKRVSAKEEEIEKNTLLRTLLQSMIGDSIDKTRGREYNQSNEYFAVRRDREMYTREHLMAHMREMRIDPNGTLLVHSSMKSIGPVEGGADTVLDAMTEYMKDGLLILPTHTWDHIGKSNPVCDASAEKSCVGLLTNMFRVRPGVIRSLHPTHSVAAIGKDAAEYVAGEENTHSPCSWAGCWGKLYQRKAQILMLGVNLSRCTFLHSVEEKMNVPGRLTDDEEELFTIAPDGTKYAVPQHRHCCANSDFFVKMDDEYASRGAMKYARFGDAECRLLDAVKSADIAMEWLKKDIDLFGNGDPLKR